MRLLGISVVACLVALPGCSTAASRRQTEARPAAGAAREAADAAGSTRGPTDTPPDQLAFAGGGGGGSGEHETTSSPTSTTASPYAQPSPDPLVESLTQDLVAAQSAAPLTLTTSDARCVASGMLARLGPEVLARLGAGANTPGAQLDVSTLDPGQRDAFADAVIGCLDLDGAIVAQVGDALDLPDDAVACLAQRVDQDGTLASVVRQALVSGTDPASSQDLLTGPMLRALTACLSPEALAKLGKPH